MKTIRILLADDHTVIAQGPAPAAGAPAGFQVVGEAADGRAGGGAGAKQQRRTWW